ncbi:MAG: phosphatase PAP2 family protein [Elusimicrobiota bacterium]|jgi:undecaprenyl-diphosphatase|nr:phosphatase PAP2 family protein [Elusimicrobiota bacterium]
MNWLIEIDHIIFKFVNNSLSNKILDFYFSVFSFFDKNSVNLWLIGVIMFSVIILLKEQKKLFCKNILALLVGLLSAAFATSLLKILIKRPRPLSVFGISEINVFFEFLYKNSFPSGHTTAVFAVCIFMFLRVKKYYFWYFLLAFGMGFERMYVGTHFFLDVLAGAIIGSFCAFAANVAILREKF